MSLRAMGQAAVTMNQLQNQIDMIGNNMANSSTPGYKAKQAEFSSLLFQQIENLSSPQNAAGRLTPDGIRVGTGARLGAINSNMALGSLQNTDRDLDVALMNENHYFQIEVQENGVNEIRYTRDGSFYLQPVNNGAEVVLVTKDGHPVMGNNGPIRFASSGIDGIDIAENGAITVSRGAQSENVGNIAVSSIEKSRILESAGDNLYRLPNLDELGFDFADIVQAVPQFSGLMKNNTLEMSNVSIADEMTQLINAQRSYQFNARTVTMADQMQGLINQIR